MKAPFLWCAIATTGLDQFTGKLLEIAVTPDASTDPVVLTIHHPSSLASEVEIASVVMRMHTGSGLWRDVEASDTTRAEADEFLAGYASDLCPRGRMQLAGFSPHFELAWCREHLPLFAARLSSKVFDMTTVIALARLSFDLGLRPADFSRPADKIRSAYGVLQEFKEYL